MTKKVEDILQFCQEKGVRMIDFKTVDLTGRWHHVTIPVERFNEDTVKYGIGFDGSNFGYASVEKRNCRMSSTFLVISHLKYDSYFTGALSSGPAVN